MRLLTGNDVSSILRSLSPDDANTILNIFSNGLASYVEAIGQDDSRIIQPQRTVFQNQDGNTVLTMPVSDGDTVVKVATVPKKGDIAGAITVYSPAGILQGVLNAAEITAFRTALATMTILTRWTAPKSVDVCVFGSGKQAEWHIRLILLLIPGIKSITVINRSGARLRGLEKSVISPLKDTHSGVSFSTVAKENNDSYDQTLSEALTQADIICCCTPSTEPLFSSAVLRSKPKRRFLSLIGSYKPGMREVDAETIELARNSGKIWVDLTEACLEEAGELIQADLEAEDLSEIGDLFSKEKGERSTLDSQRELTIFKCVGFGFMDLVISKALLEMAAKSGQGSEIDQF